MRLEARANQPWRVPHIMQYSRRSEQVSIVAENRLQLGSLPSHGLRVRPPPRQRLGQFCFGDPVRPSPQI